MTLRCAMTAPVARPTILGLVLLAGAANADDPTDDVLAGSQALLTVSVISEAELGSYRGADVSINSHNMSTETLMTMTANNSGTLTADSVSAGTLTVSGEAFGSFSGMHNSIMNTGPLNNLMAGMSVTVVLAE